MNWILLLAGLCIVGALGEKEKTPKIAKNATEPKPKREASVLGGGGYYGPSHKYLPPISSSHYISGHQSASGFGHGSLDTSEIYGHGSGYFAGSGPKVQTYIVKTESSQGNYGSSQSDGSHGIAASLGVNNLHGFSSSHGFGGSHGGGGVSHKYGGAPISFGGGHNGYQNSFSGSYSQNHAPVHKIKTIVIPSKDYSGNVDAGGSFSRFGAHNAGFGYSKGLEGAPHFSKDIGSGYTGHGNNFLTGYNPINLSGSDFSGVVGSSGYEHGNDYAVHSADATYRDSGYNSDHGDYSNEAPKPHFSHEHSYSAPSSSFGAPSALSPPYHSSSAGTQAPTYAAGHKGLGHFGFAASKPQALNTNFIDSSRYGGSYINQDHSSYAAGHGVSNAPFKPSLFLGASHENNLSGGAISTDYAPPAGVHGISSQHRSPPTSNGYDYAPISTLYGAPADVHSHGGTSGGIHELENTYLPPSPPQTNYGPPASPGDTYLPPHH